MNVTKTTSVTWGERLRESIKGVLVGAILIIVSLVGLLWNEGRAVTTTRSLTEGSGAVISVESEAIDLANEGRLVHVSGPLEAHEQIRDGGLGIATDAVRLIRRVEMYQWTESSKSETKMKVGGGQETVTTYSYATEWSSRPVDSSRFQQQEGHINPSMAIAGADFMLEKASLGAFSLGKETLERLRGEEQFSLEAGRAAQVRAAYGGSHSVSIIDGRVYLGDDPSVPAVGDYRIGYGIVPLGVVSIVGKQMGDTITRYQASAGDSLLMVVPGAKTAPDMFSDAHSANSVFTWIVRAVGMVLLYVGFVMLLAPLAVVGDVLPIFGSLVRTGSGIVSFCIALVLGPLTIALAWLFYRPLFALAIVAAGVAFAAVILRFVRRQPVIAQHAKSSPGA